VHGEQVPVYYSVKRRLFPLPSSPSRPHFSDPDEVHGRVMGTGGPLARPTQRPRPLQALPCLATGVCFISVRDRGQAWGQSGWRGSPLSGGVSSAGDRWNGTGRSRKLELPCRR